MLDNNFTIWTHTFWMVFAAAPDRIDHDVSFVHRERKALPT